MCPHAAALADSGAGSLSDNLAAAVAASVVTGASTGQAAEHAALAGLSGASVWAPVFHAL